MEFPSFTRTWHNNTYAAISPTNQSLSAANKIVLITGGGAGVGRSISQSFAAAGASKIVITGRTQKTLLAAKQEIEAAHPRTKVQTYAADITDEHAMNAAFASAGGKIDILVHNAGYLPDMEPISTSSLAEWWKGFEVNVKGAFVVTQAFLKHAAENAVLVNLITGVAHLPAFPEYSSYATSKMGALKFFEMVQAENPGLRVVNVHPGVIKTDMSDKTVAHGEVFPFDDGKLPYPIPLCRTRNFVDTMNSIIAQQLHCLGGKSGGRAPQREIRLG